MSHLLDRLQFFKKKQSEFADGHGEVSAESREWENSYRSRWQYDKIVRSTHGANCTGSCSWKIYVKNGLITWETQQTDYPRTRPDLPNHEPRGCQRGASYSWYTYSANRIKYPKVRRPLLKLWREARKSLSPVDAWASIVESKANTDAYKKKRGLGGFIRSSWNEVNEIIAASNVYTAKTFGPDRIVGFSPIPAMSMVSYAAGSRYLSLIGGVAMSFYDWYCDLPPSSPMVWGEQTDVPESADWYNSSYIIAWGSNVPQTRTPDAHFFTEVRYKGTKTVSITPDYAEVSKLTDQWLNPKQGTDSALAMAFGHVILREFHLDNPTPYFVDYARKYSDMPMLVMLDKHDDKCLKSTRFLRASDLDSSFNKEEHAEWKTVAYDENTGKLVLPNGTVGYRWQDSKGKWNLEEKEAVNDADTKLRLSLIEDETATAPVGFPYFGGQEHEYFTANVQDEIQVRNIPVRKIKLADGSTATVATVYDLLMGNYGLDRNLGGSNVASSYDDDIPFTPAWQEKITGVSREKVIQVAREFADTAAKTNGKSMIIVGAAMNHWYHMDMNYRGLINMLIMCGCIGQSGGGWAHYVGQEKLRPQTGWQPLAFGLDWSKPPRQINSTSFFYQHSSQWRHEKISINEILSPLAEKDEFPEHMIDWNVRAERMGWLPSAPQLNRNPLTIAKDAEAAGMEPKDYVVQQLKSGDLKFAAEAPDSPENFPRNMFIWRSNLLGSSGKGHEYMLKYLLGCEKHGVMNEDMGSGYGPKPTEVEWQDDGPTGKLDLVVTLDFRMSSTCMYSDIVLPTATWYEKDDLNTSDMHPFIHPLTSAVDPAWEARSDWEIYKGIAKAFSEVAEGVLGVEKDLVTVPLLHDTPGELGQAMDVKDWKKGDCELVPGKTAPNFVVVERDYPNVYKKFSSVGPLLEKQGNGGKGISWDTKADVKLLGDLNHRVTEEGVSKGQPHLDTAIDAAEMILTLAPETNGSVAVKAWDALGKFTGLDHTHLAKPKQEEKIRFRDVVAQPRKIISSPTWSGLEDEHVSYNAGYTNVHELIPWRTLTGRQQYYLDHPWMQAFGEQFVGYRPPVDTKTIKPIKDKKPNGNAEIALNWITPHQKWGIHSVYTDTLHMQTLSRGGPIIWMSEVDAKKVDIEDNDWVEVFNVNGAIACRVVVSQRVNEGMTMMYHAQERIINIPGAETTGTRGGHHNSVTRVIIKPTHMIGGYAQQAYGFNYYGTVGCNRDEFVVVRKMSKIDWLDDTDLPQPLPEEV